MTSTGSAQPHESAIGHVTGRAPFIADLPTRRDELLVGLVTSTVASGRLLAVHTEAARALPGVVAVLTAADIPGARHFGPLVADEPFLAIDRVDYVGQPLAIVAAQSAQALQQALALVQVMVAPEAPLLELDDAMTRGAFLTAPRRISRGDAADAMARAKHVRRGTLHVLGQEHVYLEPQSTLAIPGDHGQLDVHVSTQGPSETQHVVASMLGKGLHEVVCSVRRLGGGFGGKETQANLPAACAALVTHCTGRAARLVYDRGDDFRRTGKRHPFFARWTVGFDDDGRIEALQVELFADGGAFTDLSPSVMDRAMLHVDNAYFLEHVDIIGRVCRTNHAPTTAFRGFGGPQGVAVIERILHDVALACREQRPAASPTSLWQVQHANLYGAAPRDTTPYGQVVQGNHLPELLRQLRHESDFDARLSAIERENRQPSRWLRGLAMTPVKFGISFVATFMNQANAQVLVYPDGTVQVSTGGTEMGQGLHTKIRQLVADVFGIAPVHVAMMTTSTEKNHNTSPTAASASTDLNGAAAVQAAEIIRGRLARWALQHWSLPHTDVDAANVQFAHGALRHAHHPALSLGFAEACSAARFDRVDLGARGFYATPGLAFDHGTGRGTPFRYFTQGAAVAEVRVDRYTGMVDVPRVDLRIDIGRSINPAIDRGQIIGGFVQGLGWVTTECLVYDHEGALLTDSLCTYKVPLATDAPAHFRCVFHETEGPTETVARSKAVGEPPLLHALSVFGAITHALSCVSPHAARRLCLPATAEEVLRALSWADTPVESDAWWMHSARAVTAHAPRA
ncbi:xanthine dehydrogenase molybdopterin binding subunit [Gemmatimonas sp.]